MYHSTLRRYFTILLVLAGLPAFAQPTNYPTGLIATTLSATSIEVEWTGSTGGTLPTNYVVYVKTSTGTITPPTNGTLTPNDANYGDGVGFEHVGHSVGTNTFTFNGLPTNETFTFVIYPYRTGGSPDPYYKTDGTPPSVTGSTKAPVMVSTTAASNVTVNSADLGGEIGTSPNNITERGTVWKTGTGVTIGDNKLAEGGTGTGTFTDNRGSLPSGVRIYYAAYATNAVGTTLSSEASFYTYSTAPATHPTVTAEAQSPTEIALTFPAASTITDAAGYIILRTTGSAPTAASIQDGVAPGSLNLNGATLVTTITNTSTTTYSNTGLTANTRYYYAVVPYNWNGTNAQTYNYRGGAFTTDDDVTLSSISTVAFTAGTTASTIAYRIYQSGAMTNDGSNSLALGTFQIRDGGASNNDADDKPTIVESITFSITNSANVRRVALYNGTTEISGTEQSAGSSVTFTPSTPITVNDNGNTSISIRATFQSSVNDNQTIHFTVTGVTTVTSAPTSRFAAANGGGAVSSPSTDNKINVVASKFLYAALPGAALGTGQTFNLTVRAVDGNPYNNLDVDYNKQIDLEVTGGTGTIQPGGTDLHPTLSNGVYTWPNIYFSIAGTYTLKVIDDAYNPDPDLSDISGNVTISSDGVTITPPATLNLCFGGIARPLGNIIIAETDVTDFSTSGTVSLALPPGFVFDQTVTTNPTITPAAPNADISNASNLSYPATNVVEFSYTVVGTDKLSTITITGLKVRYTGTSAASGSITRLGGTANITGNQVSDANPHGSVTAVSGTAPSPFTFTVAALTGEVPVAPNQKRFSKSSNAVRLIGQPAGGVFSGPGVTFTSGEYRFNPSTLSADTYTITYTYKDATAQQCEFIHTEDFEVYVTNINNLEIEYCNNADPSPTLTVSASYITSQYGPGYAFQKFVYFNPSVGQTDMALPASNIFDPKQAVYQPIYAATASIYGTYGIWIGFVVSNGFSTFPEWQLVPIKQAPAVNFFIPKMEFCSNEAPVVLTGGPANGDNPSDDFFTATGTAVTSVTSSGTPRVWSFNPASVTGVTASTPVTFNMTYTYRDPSTGCQNTSAVQQIKVSLRPPIVPSGNITPGTSIEVCQGGTIGSFSAAAVAQTSYVWYSNNPPTTVVGAGNSFVPPVSNLIAGTSTFYVTQSINGCESTQAPRSLTVEVKASPAAPGSDFSREYCQFQNIPSSELQVTGTAVKWYDANSVLTHSGSSPSAADLDIDNTVAGPYGFTVTQTVAGCEGAKTKVGVMIKPLPNLDILPTTGDPNKICVTGGSQTFQATDNGAAAQNGTWSGTNGINSALIPIAAAGTVQLNASLLLPNSYTLHLVYQNPTTLCSNTKDLALTVLPTIAPSYTIGTACDGFPVSITNTSTMVPINATDTIASTSWSFGDGTSLSAGSGEILPGPNTVKTTGTYFSPNHIFNGIGNFLAEFTMVTSSGCIITPPKIPITINPNPDGTFAWRNVCVDPSGGSDTEFLAGTSNISEANIQSYDWNFSKHNQLVVGTVNAPGTGKISNVNYISVGTDTVRLIITTTASCKDTIQKPVYMVPSFGTVTETNAYTQDFNGTADGWITGGIRSSWAHGHPAGATVNKDASPNGLGGAWDTNLTGNSNAGEQSWVMSRCFDFSLAQKPIISFDIWSDTPAGNDGAVLQYNTSGNIENEAQWQVVGQIGQGVNWYDESGISSRPGNQPSNDLGWTGAYGDWKTATFKLDNLIGEANVVFRIAFASNAPRREGFAFDNIFIGERTRTVLIENFTNSSAAANGTAHNALFNAFSQNSPEIAKIQFHTAFPGSDPLNAINAEINNARTAFYGITTSPTFSLDGNVVNTTPALEALYNERILTPSPIRLDVTMTKEGEVVKIKTSITNATSQVLPTAGVNVFTTIVEKTITDPAYLGASGNAEFHYVAKEMLPTAAGIRLTQDIAPMQTIVLDEVVWRNRDLLTSGEGAVVIFMQSIEGGNKEVFQAKVIDATDEPDFVTANEPTFGDQVRVYPNPTRGEVNIDLPVKAAQDLPVSLVDGFGRTVYQQVFQRGDKRKTISTASFPDGVYILQVRSAEGSVMHRKLVITH
ncbi:T9SS type A sorting domain-containing protein [Fulvivirgaceae bacterium PWU5]|uniref:T9SS type A sorting domain-containing protein n=1 Tax=Dawidia cretensis TaxID=2782350 RepID=A0AAP2GTW8_9BACT|nr:T9SS type A sorting domain-containing protein [Dawidia cretensis]MBT1707985.1 T9SS type A sorting domain-containing protein [Dawidia cretensis]